MIPFAIIIITFEPIYKLAEDCLLRHIQKQPVKIRELLLSDLDQLRESSVDLKASEK